MKSVWSPDTCSCELVYSKGGNLRENFTGAEKKCKKHAGLDGMALHDAVVALNQSFNVKIENMPKQDLMELKGKEKTKNSVKNG